MALNGPSTSRSTRRNSTLCPLRPARKRDGYVIDAMRSHFRVTGDGLHRSPPPNSVPGPAVIAHLPPPPRRPAVIVQLPPPPAATKLQIGHSGNCTESPDPKVTSYRNLSLRNRQCIPLPHHPWRSYYTFHRHLASRRSYHTFHCHQRAGGHSATSTATRSNKATNRALGHCTESPDPKVTPS